MTADVVLNLRHRLLVLDADKLTLVVAAAGLRDVLARLAELEIEVARLRAERDQRHLFEAAKTPDANMDAARPLHVPT